MTTDSDKINLDSSEPRDSEPLVPSLQRHKKPFLSLQTKLISGVILIMLVVVVGMTFVLLDQNRADLLLQLAKEAQGVAGTCTEAVLILYEQIPGAETERLQAAIQNLCVEAARSTGVESVALITPGLLHFAHSNSAMVGMSSTEPDVTAYFQQGPPYRVWSKHLARTSNKEIVSPKIQVFHPIQYMGEFLGIIKVKIDLSVLEEQFHYSRRNTIKIILIECLVIMVFTGLLLNIIVIRPIYRLVQATQQVAKGNLRERVEVVSIDEFGELAEAFNAMIAKLRASREKADEYVQSLEEAYRDLQKAQQELIASDKQASIGRLAAGVAHEIGNPLSSLLGFTEILQMGMVSKEEEATYLKDMQREIQRISDIVRDLLDFSRQKELDLALLDVNPTLERTWRLLSTLPEFKEVEVILDLSEDLPEVLLEENLLQQIATNIMVNAAQAMNGKGKLTVTSKFVGGEVLVGFQDTGPGVAPENEKHLFEPFFTTKDVGTGTGLGLSVSQNLIEKCGGVITFRNTEPGALFTLHIPVPAEQTTESIP